MNCSECEQLFDAYLDGQLTGSLRLEFDAHRLRCRHCQQMLAMLETVGNVIASDEPTPDLSLDFTARVLADVARPPRRLRISRRIVVVGALGLQAAAVLLLVLLVNTRASAPRSAPDFSTVWNVAGQPVDPGEEALKAWIVRRIEDRAWEMHAAGASLAADLTEMRRYMHRYANTLLPDDFRKSAQNVSVNPVLGLLEVVVPGEAAEPESVPPPTVDGLYTI